MNKHILLVAIMAFLGTAQLLSCKSAENFPISQPSLKPKYARLFSAEIQAEGTLVKVYDPVDTSKTLKQYFLYRNTPPKSLPKDSRAVKIPLQSVGCAHSTQIGYVNALGLADKITSVGSKALLEKKSILSDRDDLGEFFNGWQFDIERLITINADAVFFTPGGSENINSAQELPSPIIFELSAWESHPLARSEWVKFIALFFDQAEKAESIFSDIESKYISMVDLAKQMDTHPSILSSYLYQNVWWLPAGESYKALMYTDAALEYPWADSKGIGSLGLDLETVLSKAHNCDVWFMEFGFMDDFSKAKFLEQNKFYGRFKAFEQSKIFVCNTDDVPYFETGIMEPHKILEDYIHLSRGTKGYIGHYYQALK